LRKFSGKDSDVRDRWIHEKELRDAGHELVAGVDEAGRGPLAGPVVAAAVILSMDFSHAGVRDSKLLTARKREEMDAVIRKEALAWTVVSVGEREIERLNILQATLRAMRETVRRLRPPPGFLLVDAVKIPDLDIPQRSIIKGDRLSVSIAAASILAKVERDRIMDEYHLRYPQYGFASHKGYGTARHREAIRLYGPCDAHRRSFRGVKEFCEPRNL
jgi:ribonuclease HII